jgi:hypothetical protein
MQANLRRAAAAAGGYVVSSAHPRLVDGKPTKNPRYLQTRPDVVDPFPAYVAKRGVRLARAIPPDQPAHLPVDAVLVGRRNNPAEPAAHVRPLAVYNPIHYQELPELFMDFIASLTGKSPSTTGAGSEGALTKGRSTRCARRGPEQRAGQLRADRPGRRSRPRRAVGPQASGWTTTVSC